MSSNPVEPEPQHTESHRKTLQRLKHASGLELQDVEELTVSKLWKLWNPEFSNDSI